MDVTIIGTGNMGKALAARTLAGGHKVTLLGTTPEKAEGWPKSSPATCAPARSATR